MYQTTLWPAEGHPPRPPEGLAPTHAALAHAGFGPAPSRLGSRTRHGQPPSGRGWTKRVRRIADAGGLEAVVSGQFTHTFVEFVKYRYSLLLIVVVQFTVHVVGRRP